MGVKCPMSQRPSDRSFFRIVPNRQIRLKISGSSVPTFACPTVPHTRNFMFPVYFSNSPAFKDQGPNPGVSHSATHATPRQHISVSVRPHHYSLFALLYPHF